MLPGLASVSQLPPVVHRVNRCLYVLHKHHSVFNNDGRINVMIVRHALETGVSCLRLLVTISIRLKQSDVM